MANFKHELEELKELIPGESSEKRLQRSYSEIIKEKKEENVIMVKSKTNRRGYTKIDKRKSK